MTSTGEIILTTVVVVGGLLGAWGFVWRTAADQSIAARKLPAGSPEAARQAENLRVRRHQAWAAGAGAVAFVFLLLFIPLPQGDPRAPVLTVLLAVILLFLGWHVVAAIRVAELPGHLLMQSHLSERVQGTPSEVEHRVSAFLLVNGYTRSGGAAARFARGSRGQRERAITPQSDYTEVSVQVAAAKDEAHLDVAWRLEEVKLSKREFAKVARLRAREEYLPIERDALLAAARGEPHADRAELALQSHHATLGRVYVDRWVLIGIAALFATLWAAAKAPAAIDAIQLGGVAIGRAVIIVAGTAVSRWLARQSRAGKSTPQRKRIAEQLAVLKRRREHVTTPTDRPDAPPTPEPPPPPDRRS